MRATRIADRIASGVAENIAVVSGNTMELSSNLGVPLGTPGADGNMPAAPPPEIPLAQIPLLRRTVRPSTSAANALSPRLHHRRMFPRRRTKGLTRLFKSL